MNLDFDLTEGCWINASPQAAKFRRLNLRDRGPFYRCPLAFGKQRLFCHLWRPLLPRKQICKRLTPTSDDGPTQSLGYDCQTSKSSLRTAYRKSILNSRKLVLSMSCRDFPVGGPANAIFAFGLPLMSRLYHVRQRMHKRKGARP